MGNLTKFNLLFLENIQIEAQDKSILFMLAINFSLNEAPYLLVQIYFQCLLQLCRSYRPSTDTKRTICAFNCSFAMLKNNVS